MSTKYLGESFDIHGGGLDLRFPHHENELAQSAAAGDGFAQFWLHNGMVTFEGEKMSKSLGNTISPEEMLAAARPKAVRYFLGQAHYRSQLVYRPGSLQEAEAALDRIEGFLARAFSGHDFGFVSPGVPEQFREALDDDLNVPAALAVLHETVRAGNTALDQGNDDAAATSAAQVFNMLTILGIDDVPEPQSGGGPSAAALDSLVAELLQQRAEAKAAKDFATADAIRDRLAEVGIEVEDTAAGSQWSLKGGASTHG